MSPSKRRKTQHRDRPVEVDPKTARFPVDRLHPDWQEIIARYDALTEELPPDESPLVLYQVRLAVCRARLEMLDLDVAINDLTRLLQETAAVYGEHARITRGVREQLGKAHYYATWVLKTNGAPEVEWRPFAERARQLFRYLAELENPDEFRRYENRVYSEFERMREESCRPVGANSPAEVSPAPPVERRNGWESGA